MATTPGTNGGHLKAVASSWSPRDGANKDYDPDKVYTHTRGGTEQTTMRLSEVHARFMLEFVQGRYHADVRTITDFVRDAIHHRIEYWRAKMPEIDTAAVDMAAMIEMAEAINAETELAKSIAPAWTAALKNATNGGDRLHVLKVIAAAEKVAAAAPRPARKAIADAIDEARTWLKNSRPVTGL